MKNWLAVMFFGLLAVACGSPEGTVNEEVSDEAVKSYGAVIEEADVMSTEELMAALSQQDTVECTMKAGITGTCAKKGCWMTLDAGLEDDMRVRFTDYGFFVPTEGQEGKEAVIKGRAFKSVTDVDMLRHYAEDAGKSEEEIMAITEPEVSFGFEADGVLIYQ